MKRNFARSIFVFPFILALAYCGNHYETPAKNADVVFRNAKIVTMDEEHPSATALAVIGEKIAAVGSFSDLEHLIGPGTKVYDLEGRTLVPGLNETHIHVQGLGFEQYYATNLEPARNIADVQKRLKDRLATLQQDGKLDGWRYPTTGDVGPWLFGLGWHQDRLEEKRMANRLELDEVSRDIPISLTRVYRGIAVNTKVFELLGIDFDDPATYPNWFTEDPADFEAGDIIFRDPDTGLPNGVFVGTKAPALITKAVASRTFEQNVESLVLGLEVLATYGITSVVDAGSNLGQVTRLYQAAYAKETLPVRAIVYDGFYNSGSAESLGDPDEIEKRLQALGINNIGDNMFRVRGAKTAADGGVGARSAVVSESYLPIPEDPRGSANYGTYKDSDFDYRLAQFQHLADYGWEIHTHACGDAAIRQTMDVYKILLDPILEKDPNADPRWSIVHCYMPDEPKTSVIQEMVDYRVIAAINPANLYFEGDSFLRNIGPDRMARHTPFKTFLDAGILMASGSDYPTNSPDPWIGIYTMVTRKHQISGEVHGPEQRISLLEALKTFTINGAYLTYDEDIRGSLEVGKLADLAVVDADLMTASNEELLQMGSKVLITMVGGKVVYQKQGFVLN